MGLINAVPLDHRKTTVVAENISIATNTNVASPFALLEYVDSYLALTLAVGEGKKIDFSEQIMMLVEHIQFACRLNADAALASLFVLKGGSYPIKHSVDVAVITEIMAKKLLIPQQERRSLLAAALTMNISKIELQELLYQQEAPLTEQQKKAIYEHPENSVRMLRQVKVADELWLSCVLSHHENLSGTGYPNHLKGNRFLREMQLIAIADQYCARLSPRAYRDPLLHRGILREILINNGHEVSLEIGRLLIKELGVYPPGLVVQMANLEIGVVINVGDKIDSPIVSACKSPTGEHYKPTLLRDTSESSYKIIKILPQNSPHINVDIRSLWGFDDGHGVDDAALNIIAPPLTKREQMRLEVRKEIDQLPLLPKALSQLMALSIEDEHFFELILELAEQDPTLTVMIIRQANTVGNASISKTSVIKRAVARIGARQIKNLLTIASVAQVFIPRNKSESDLWLHSVQVAVASKAIARMLTGSNIDPDQAYLCGLLHDLGRFILFKNIPDSIVDIDEKDWDSVEQLIIAEDEVCGMNHAELGALASVRWALPNDVSAVIRLHHSYDYDTFTTSDKKMSNLVKIIQMADRFSVGILREPDTLNLSSKELEAKIAAKCIHSSWSSPPVSPALLQQEAVHIYEKANNIVKGLGISFN